MLPTSIETTPRTPLRNERQEQGVLRLRPLISVILAVYNEAAMIRDCLASILSQDTFEIDLEVLVIDGKSMDGTREFLEKMSRADRRVRILTNEQKHTPFAFNLGLREARGEYVCILGAHTIYRQDYISVCWHQLQTPNAAGCGGRVITRPAKESLQARLVAAALAHPFGTSRKSFRTQREGFVDTVNYPVLRKSALHAVGGYREELLRNQDNDMSRRLREAGHKLYCTWQTQCFYHPQSTVAGLFRYAFRNGFWNVISFKRNPACMGSRHFIPSLYVLSLLAAGVFAISSLWFLMAHAWLALLPLWLLLGLHLVVGTAAAVDLSFKRRFAGGLWLPLVFLGLHLAYGVGTLAAIVTGAGSAPAATAPCPKRRPVRREAVQ